MNFTLTINGDTPAELLDTLTQLGGMTINVNTSPNGGVETHTMTAAEPPRRTSPQPQSTPVQQPDKPKAQTPAKAKKPTREPAAAPAEEPANPTHTPAQNMDAAATAEFPAAPAQSPTATTQADASTSSAEPDPATLDKIRDLARSLIVAGKRAGVQAAIKATGAASISKLPPDSYTSVWEELLKLKDEVDANASN